MRPSKRYNPKAGDEKIKDGKVFIRIHKRVPKGMPFAGAYCYSYGRPLYEWVEKETYLEEKRKREASLIHVNIKKGNCQTGVAISIEEFKKFEDLSLFKIKETLERLLKLEAENV